MCRREASITFAAPTLGAVLSKRFGQIGDLAASCANLETPLPLIDIVNECLEYMGAQASPSNGTVYNTSSDELAGHILCQEEPCPEKDKKANCHEPARIFAALPEYSTPATPVSANSTVEPSVYNILKTDFSSCKLPYSQALDVSRTYLRHFRSCRFEEMRTFRKCITEFVLDPTTDPPGFQSHLWRYPVRIDIAIEYLGITPEEYALLFLGPAASPCAAPANQQPPANPNQPPSPDRPNPLRPPNTDQPPGEGNQPPRGTSDGPPIVTGTPANGIAVWTLYGFPSEGDNDSWINTIAQLPEFLARTCLTYCEFYELWKSGFVPFRNSEQENGEFPECEPCCLDQISIEFPDERDGQQEQPAAIGDLHPVVAKVEGIVLLLLLLLATSRHLRRLAPFQRHRHQSRFHSPVGCLSNAPRPVLLGTRRSLR